MCFYNIYFEEIYFDDSRKMQILWGEISLKVLNIMLLFLSFQLFSSGVIYCTFFVVDLL